MIYHYCMNDSENKLIPASTVLIIRDGIIGLEVFMVVRHHEIDFASGALVFPGGKVDKNDYDKKLKNLSYVDETDNSETLPFKIAAIRESFEEANVLYANDKSSKSHISLKRLKNLSNWREKFNDNHASMIDFASNEDLIFSTKSLIPFAHWITPKKMPKRFDTRFYIAEAPKDHEGEHDGTESVDSIWISPQQALDDCYSKKRTIIFPTRLNLEKLSQSNTVEEALENARNSKIITVTPSINKIEGEAFLTIPEKAGYGLIKKLFVNYSFFKICFRIK